MISVLIYILIVALICGLVYWAADAIPLPHPFNRIVKVVAIVAFVLIVALALLGVINDGPYLPLLR